MKAPRTYTMTARARAQEATARRVLAAAREAFIEDPYEDVTLARIAERAGVSHQTLLNHFGSKERLFAAFGEELAGEIDRIRERATAGDPRSVAHALLTQYERLGDANARWDLLEERLPVFAGVLQEARRYHRAWLERMFAAWLDVPARERGHRLALLYVATDVKTWKLLRRQLGLGRRTTGELMLRLVEAALDERTPGEGSP